jgi:16S rRNA G966 N2-methylase RsmD
MDYRRRLFSRNIFINKNGVDLSQLRIDEDGMMFATWACDSVDITQQIIKRMKKYNMEPSDITIVDATACTELAKDKYNMMVHNLSVYGFTNAYPINDDCVKIIKDIEVPINICMLDPPWGGKSYKEKEKLQLSLSDMSLEDVVIMFFELKKELKLITLKLPNNYDFDMLREKLHMCTIEIYPLKKMQIVFLERKNN